MNSIPLGILYVLSDEARVNNNCHRQIKYFVFNNLKYILHNIYILLYILHCIV